jgi:hypothetical protein
MVPQSIETTEQSTPVKVTLAPPELVAQAVTLVKQYPECFWFWKPEASIRYLEDIKLVVAHLRKYGGRHAWNDAQDLLRCLSPHFKKTF